MREKHVLAIDIPTVPSIHELVYKPISYIVVHRYSPLILHVHQVMCVEFRDPTGGPAFGAPERTLSTFASLELETPEAEIRAPSPSLSQHLAASYPLAALT